MQRCLSCYSWMSKRRVRLQQWPSMWMYRPKQQLTTGSFKANIKQSSTEVLSLLEAMLTRKLCYYMGKVQLHPVAAAKAAVCIWVATMMFLGGHRFLVTFRYSCLIWLQLPKHERAWDQRTGTKICDYRRPNTCVCLLFNHEGMHWEQGNLQR